MRPLQTVIFSLKSLDIIALHMTRMMIMSEGLCPMLITRKVTAQCGCPGIAHLQTCISDGDAEWFVRAQYSWRVSRVILGAQPSQWSLEVLDLIMLMYMSRSNKAMGQKGRNKMFPVLMGRRSNRGGGGERNNLTKIAHDCSSLRWFLNPPCPNKQPIPITIPSMIIKNRHLIEYSSYPLSRWPWISSVPSFYSFLLEYECSDNARGPCSDPAQPSQTHKDTDRRS